LYFISGDLDCQVLKEKVTAMSVLLQFPNFAAQWSTVIDEAFYC
jgi:hypothetical protein